MIRLNKWGGGHLLSFDDDRIVLVTKYELKSLGKILSRFIRNYDKLKLRESSEPVEQLVSGCCGAEWRYPVMANFENEDKQLICRDCGRYCRLVNKAL